MNIFCTLKFPIRFIFYERVYFFARCLVNGMEGLFRNISFIKTLIRERGRREKSEIKYYDGLYVCKLNPVFFHHFDFFFFRHLIDRLWDSFSLFYVHSLAFIRHLWFQWVCTGVFFLFICYLMNSFFCFCSLIIQIAIAIGNFWNSINTFVLFHNVIC